MNLEEDQAKAVDPGALHIKVIGDTMYVQCQVLGQQECRKIMKLGGFHEVGLEKQEEEQLLFEKEND